MGSIPGDKQLFIPIGFYKGCKVAIKRIHESNITLNREQMLELKRVSVEVIYCRVEKNHKKVKGECRIFFLFE